jgi:hypothetical protein
MGRRSAAIGKLSQNAQREKKPPSERTKPGRVRLSLYFPNRFQFSWLRNHCLIGELVLAGAMLQGGLVCGAWHERLLSRNNL